MSVLPNILFTLILLLGLGLFSKNMLRLRRNIHLGKEVNFSGQKSQRWKNMILIALGQTKMVRRPIAGILHLVVYVGFIIINIELLEIVIDGIFGTHRIFASLGSIYGFLIGSFEVLAILVFVAVVVFWFRRNIIKLSRFIKSEMQGWPKTDGNLILYFEMLLMGLFLLMNAADAPFQSLNSGNVISGYLRSFFNGMSLETLYYVERTAWWLHIIGILVFLNYLYYSKHLHILLAFPNTYYAKLSTLGTMDNLVSVTNEVKLMMDPSVDPYADTSNSNEVPEKFGASDIQDFNWLQLLNAYTCTECGRCTSQCPANITGKKLSPRKIMMDTRDRITEVGKNIDTNNGTFVPDGKQLLNDYISKEEIWACTSCNACVEACPISIDPLSIIMDMRRYLVMEESAAPSELNTMMSNIENNGAPWPYNQMDRLNWKTE
jgi:heterodisulfide reductase subunit C